MKSRFTKAALAVVAVAALAAPTVAEARHGSDDPAGHVRQEHHRFGEHHRSERQQRLERRHRRGDDGARHERDRHRDRHDRDDGPNDR